MKRFMSAKFKKRYIVQIYLTKDSNNVDPDEAAHYNLGYFSLRISLTLACTIYSDLFVSILKIL